jgi:hypothetical protein
VDCYFVCARFVPSCIKRMHFLERFRLVEFYLSYTLSETFRTADIAQ